MFDTDRFTTTRKELMTAIRAEVKERCNNRLTDRGWEVLDTFVDGLLGAVDETIEDVQRRAACEAISADAIEQVLFRD